MATPAPHLRRHTPTLPDARDTTSTNTRTELTHLVPVLGLRRPVHVSGHRDRRLATIAVEQRGVVTRSQLLAAGLTRSQIHGLLATARMFRIHTCVYVVGHTAPIELQPETAAVLACGPGAVLSHQTAARIYGLLRRPGDSLHVTICAARTRGRPRGITVHRSKSLDRSDVRTVERLPLTSPGRTLLGLAEVVEPRELDWAVDEALQRRMVTVKALLDRARSSNDRGRARLRRAVERHRAPGVTRSVAEKRFRELIRQAGLPEPRSNVRVHGFEVDFYWPQHRLVVEVDGYRFHSARPKFEHDSAKGAALVAAGLAVMRVTWLQMTDDCLGVVARVAQALAPGP